MARILFLQWDEVPRQGIMALSAWLRLHGHRTAVATPDRLPELADLDLVGFSLHASDLAAYRAFVPRLRALRPDLPIVVGGVLATVRPTLIDPAPDLLVRGEGELPLLAWMDHLDRHGDGCCDGLWRAGAPTTGQPVARRVPLDRLPHPDHALYPDGFPGGPGRRVGHFMFSRGCAFACTFCYAPAWNALHPGEPAVRFRDPEDAVAEMVEVARSHPFDHARLYDDNLGLDVRWLDRFARAYRERVGLPFACYLRADLVDQRRVRLLAEAGCVEVGMGVESWNDDLRTRLLAKRIGRGEFHEAVRLLRLHGIGSTVFLIFGLPGETARTALQNVTMLGELAPDFVWTSRLQVYPGTPMESHVVEGRIYRHRDDDFTRAAVPGREVLFRIESLMPAAHAWRLPAGMVGLLARLPFDGTYRRIGTSLRRRHHEHSLICCA
jgi:radical SAM superfamily enzyme YgiQ (UPF0313 family)